MCSGVQRLAVDMADLLVSLAVVGAVVLLCELSRRAAARLLPGAYWIYLLELASTLQLCWCAGELKLLGEMADLPLSVRLTLVYTMTVIHLESFRGASCSIISPLDRVCRQRIDQLQSGRRPRELSVCGGSRGADFHGSRVVAGLVRDTRPAPEVRIQMLRPHRRDAAGGCGCGAGRCIYHTSCSSSLTQTGPTTSSAFHFCCCDRYGLPW